MLRLAALAVGVYGAAGLESCDPCHQQCDIPCHQPRAHLPMVWDDSMMDEDTGIQPGQFNLNPYNSIRPEYRDATPSKLDLVKIWQHHLNDHSYRSPFVRPMKSGLWEAGVPNRYAPSGYNRRKFKTEEEALKYVRHKTGAGSNIVYEPDQQEDDAEITEEPEEGAGGFLELASFTKHVTPTIDEDKTELVASASETNADNTALDESEQAIRDDRDHNVKVAHKIRDFLSNYRPDHKVNPVSPGFDALFLEK